MMTVSRDQVIWVYRTLLFRDPESEDIIAENIRHHADRLDMIIAVMQSEEFKSQYRDDNG